MNIHRLLLYVLFIFIVLHLIWYRLNPIWITHILIIETLLFLSWICGSYFYETMNRRQLSPYKKIVLITGCDTGFGHALAKRLDQYGVHVFAGVLNVEGEGAKELKAKCSNRMRVIKLDVTKVDDVNNVVHQIRQSRTPLWALVNNAGIGIGCPFDWGNDVDEYRRVFEVNVFGLVRLTKSCISLLRHSNGRVVNVSSLADRLTMPQMSHYCMSKAAVRAFTDAIRREPLNSKLKVILVEPTIYRTPIINFELIKRTRERVYSETTDEIKAFYGQRYFDSIKHSGKNVNAYARTNIEEVVDALESAVTLAQPKPVYWCCSWWHSLVLQIGTRLPEPIVDLAIKIEQRKFCNL